MRSLILLFQKCQSDARYLFQDIMPTILSVHAQTVQVIRTAVQNMVVEVLPEVPCKRVMPLWMERLKIDKSRTVREACALYLGQALQYWSSNDDPSYLTADIWLQVGLAVLAAVRDPSPKVRTLAKEILERISHEQPAVWDQLLNDGPRDPKVLKWLHSLGKGGTVETDELSVASKMSYNGDIRLRAGASPPTKIPLRKQTTPDRVVPSNIQVSRLRRNDGGLGPPLRRGGPFPQAASETPEGKPALEAATTGSSSPMDLAHRRMDSLEISEATSFPENLEQTFGRATEAVTSPPSRGDAFSSAASSSALPIPPAASFDSTVGDEGPFITSLQELKRHASKRRSRNSMLMQERFRMSSSFVEEQAAPAPEHMVIAIRMLRAHKEHVDSIMETLRIEMDTLRDFDKLLEEPGRPTEEEVLDYFESVGLCLDQRSQAGHVLQRELDRISRGEPPQT